MRNSIGPSTLLVALASLGLFLFQTPSAASQDSLHVFVTSATGSGDLSSWTYAQGSTGLVAADAICRASADIAGLPNPTVYVAWMSDSANDAYCRVHGFSGLKSANCGQPYLPIYGGYWVRTDGKPFSGHIGDLVEPAEASTVYYPILLDEFGTRASSAYFTATDADGALSGDTSVTCADWTAASMEMVGLGYSARTTWSWSFAGTTACSSSRALLCFEMGYGDALPPYSSGGAVTFVTSVDGTGDLGSWPDAGSFTGLDAGDAICRQLATDAGLEAPESFMAWLSDSNTDAKDRFTYSGPWIRPDGVRIANGITDLTNGELFSALNVKEDGKYFGNRRAWTGTLATGYRHSDNCSNWTSSNAAVDGRIGVVNTADSDWSDSISTQCSNGGRHLYCFSQVATHVFDDGFESTNSDGWSSSVGESLP